MVGTKDSNFVEINEKTGSANVLTCGHGEGELWGLATHPSAEKFATASDDGTVRLWDIVQKVVSIYRIYPARSLISLVVWRLPVNGRLIHLQAKVKGCCASRHVCWRPHLTGIQHFHCSSYSRSI